MDLNTLVLSLSITPGVSRKTIKLLVNDMMNVEDINAEALLNRIISLQLKNPRIKPPNIDQIRDAFVKAEFIINKSEAEGIGYLTFLGDRFPNSLKWIPDAPVQIFYKGNLEVLNNGRRVAIVGTREPSPHGEKVAYKFGHFFAQEGCIVISGLAIGCDTLAHMGCVSAKGKTVAVLAHGLDQLGSASSRNLADKIIMEGGLLLSEYPVGTKPFKPFYIERDRIESALSKGIMVIETNLVGGTMHTVEFAKKQKRLIACYKHPEQYEEIPECRGNRKLISDGIASPVDSENTALQYVKQIEEFVIENDDIKQEDFDIQMVLPIF